MELICHYICLRGGKLYDKSGFHFLVFRFSECPVFWFPGNFWIIIPLREPFGQLGWMRMMNTERLFSPCLYMHLHVYLLWPLVFRYSHVFHVQGFFFMHLICLTSTHYGCFSTVKNTPLTALVVIMTLWEIVVMHTHWMHKSHLNNNGDYLFLEKSRQQDWNNVWESSALGKSVIHGNSI